MEHVAHLDAQASYYGSSRAAYLRGLIVRDMERQGPTVAKATLDVGMSVLAAAPGIATLSPPLADPW